MSAINFLRCGKMGKWGLRLLIVLNLLLLSGCNSASKLPDASPKPSPSLDEAARTAYSSFLSGDMTLLEDSQSEKWWIPDFQDENMEYEYTCLDLDGDGAVELLVQMADDPCGYNAVFHFEDGKLFCWNSDAMEMSCRDYPLLDGTMVRQYDFNGTCSYTLFCYGTGGETKELSHLSACEELIPENGDRPCPYYEIDGVEIDKSGFEKQLAALVTSRTLSRSAWTALTAHRE